MALFDNSAFGSLLLQAADSIIATHQQQQQLQLQREQFDQQVKQQDRLFQLQSQQFQAQEGALKAKQAQLQAEQAVAAGLAQGLGLDPNIGAVGGLKGVQTATQAIENLRPSGGGAGGLTANQRRNAKSDARSLAQRRLLNDLAAKQGVMPFTDVDEYRSRIEDLRRQTNQVDFQSAIRSSNKSLRANATKLLAELQALEQMGQSPELDQILSGELPDQLIFQAAVDLTDEETAAVIMQSPDISAPELDARARLQVSPAEVGAAVKVFRQAKNPSVLQNQLRGLFSEKPTRQEAEQARAYLEANTDLTTEEMVEILRPLLTGSR